MVDIGAVIPTIFAGYLVYRLEILNRQVSENREWLNELCDHLDGPRQD